ncbi:MAG: sulfotransferase domain-containing protein [Paracoccaceae bacterium]|nr:sulfotransferase domain-containing protein [Paracoccaceae bacterium]
MAAVRQLVAADRHYRGTITEPERWEGYVPRKGDVILVTPAKSGTTWTQSMIAMLLHGAAELPDKLGVVSPWIDANTAPRDQVEAILAAMRTRRVIKTHTPADGWPVWEGVDAVTVFRHPLEVFLSIRKHLANSKLVDEHPLLEPVETSLPYFLDRPFDEGEVDRDSLTAIVRHFEHAVLSARLPQKLVLHYAAISRDHAGTVARLNDFLDTNASSELQAAITKATSFGAMKARASDFAPEAANDFWHSDAAFFAAGQAGTWHDNFTDTQIDLYQSRFAELLPDPAHRHWIETGEGDV